MIEVIFEVQIIHVRLLCALKVNKINLKRLLRKFRQKIKIVLHYNPQILRFLLKLRNNALVVLHSSRMIFQASKAIIIKMKIIKNILRLRKNWEAQNHLSKIKYFHITKFSIKLRLRILIPLNQLRGIHWPMETTSTHFRNNPISNNRIDSQIHLKLLTIQLANPSINRCKINSNSCSN